MHAREYEKKHGKNVIYLNIGDPVQYDYPTPDHIKNALIKAVQNNENYYTASEGLPSLLGSPSTTIISLENELETYA